MTYRSIIQPILFDHRGATMVEFAFVAPPLFMVLLGLVDFGYRVYATAIVEGTLQQASRLATIGDKTGPDIDAYIKTKLTEFNASATISISKTNYYRFSNVSKGETLTKDINSNGIWESGDCYEDLANFGKWDANAGRDGLGGSDDVVWYQVTFTFNRLVPLGSFLGWSKTESISANTVVRNQPYAAQTIPIIRGGSTEAGYCT